MSDKGYITIVPGAVADSAGNTIEYLGIQSARINGENIGTPVGLNFTVCSIFYPNQYWYNTETKDCELCLGCGTGEVREGCGGRVDALGTDEATSVGAATNAPVTWSNGTCRGCPSGYESTQTA